MQWQSENAFTQSIHTLPRACSIIPISCNPNDTSLPSQCMQPASILRRQMEQSCKLPPACSKQRDASANIEKAESKPINPIVTLDCCFLTGILHSTPHSVRCATSAGHKPVRNSTHQIRRNHKLLMHKPDKNADAISTQDIQRQRCIKTGLQRAQEVPLCRQRTHPSISRLKPICFAFSNSDRSDPHKYHASEINGEGLHIFCSGTIGGLTRESFTPSTLRCFDRMASCWQNCKSSKHQATAP